jgi:hypothetical protein
MDATPKRKPKKLRKPQQLALPLPPGRGGKRAGAGRKRKGPRPRVPHRPRARIDEHKASLVTTRLRPDIWRLRSERCFRAVRRSLVAGCARFGARIVHFTAQANHLHLVLEADDRRCLWRCMQGLSVRIAKAVSKVMDRHGSVFSDRYHNFVFASPRAARNALRYVLLNTRRHDRQLGRARPARWVDPLSSALYFDGWREQEAVPKPRPDDPWPVVAPQSYLLRVLWRRRGLIAVRRGAGPKGLRGGGVGGLVVRGGRAPGAYEWAEIATRDARDR